MKPVQLDQDLIVRHLDDIFIPPAGPKNLQTWNYIEPEPEVLAMRDSINETGLNSLLIVNPSASEDTNKEFTINDGNKRWNALYLKYLDPDDPFDGELNLIVEDEIKSDEDRLLEQMSSNAHSSGLIPKNFASACLLLESKGLSFAEIAKRTGFSTRQISRIIKTVTLPVAIQEKIGTGEHNITLTNAVALSKIVKKVVDEEEFYDYVDKAVTLNREDFKKDVDRRIDAWKQDRKATITPAQEGFQGVIPVMLKKDILEGLLNEIQNEYEGAKTDRNQYRLELIQDIFQCSEIHEAKARADWEQNQLDKQAKSKLNREKKADQKLADEVTESIAE